MKAYEIRRRLTQILIECNNLHQSIIDLDSDLAKPARQEIEKEES